MSDPAFILYDGTHAASVLFDASRADIPALTGLWVEVTVTDTGVALDFQEDDRTYGKRFRPTLLDDVLGPIIRAAIDDDDFSLFRSLDGNQGVADLDRMGRYR